MNDAKSAPFAHIQTLKNPCTPPQITKKPIIFTNNAKFANHFPIHTMVNGTLKIYSKLCKSTQFTCPYPKSCKIHTIHADFQGISPLAKLPKFVTFAHSCNLTDFAQFTLAGKQARLQRIQ